MESEDELSALNSKHEMELSAMREHVEVLQRENEEMRDKYQCALQDAHNLEMEKELMQKEVNSLREEMLEMRERSEELRDTVTELQMEKTLLFEPAVSHLEHSQNETTHLESQLAQEQEFAKQLSSQLSCSMEENQRYREALEHNDVTLRRKQESSKNALNALHQQIDHLQSENDELKKELVRYELDIMRLRQREYQQPIEEEKVRDTVGLESLDQIGGTVEVEVTCDDIEEDARSDSGDSIESLQLESTLVVGRRRDSRRSIVMSIHDLASIVRKSETVDPDNNVCSHCLGSYLNLNHNVSDRMLLEETPFTPAADKWNELKMENEALMEKLGKKQKRIDSLTDTIAVLQMEKAKKQNCKSFMPWCG